MEGGRARITKRREKYKGDIRRRNVTEKCPCFSSGQGRKSGNGLFSQEVNSPKGNLPVLENGGETYS